MAWPDRMDVTIERARDRHVTDSVCVCVREREREREAYRMQIVTRD